MPRSIILFLIWRIKSYDSLKSFKHLEDAHMIQKVLSSAAHATLGMGGWLDLTQLGLSPSKKRQTCLAHQEARSGEKNLIFGFSPGNYIRHSARSVSSNEIKVFIRIRISVIQ